MARGIVGDRLQVAQFPEPAFRRWPLFLQHRFQGVTCSDNFIDMRPDHIFRQDRRRCLPQRACLGINSNGRDMIAALIQHDLDIYRRAAHARHLQHRGLGALKRADMRNVRCQFQDTVVVKFAHHAHRWPWAALMTSSTG